MALMVGTSDASEGGSSGAGAGGAPGKTSRTQQLGGRGAAARPGVPAADPPPVQADGAQAAVDDPFAFHTAAQSGVAGPAEPLPHREAIQASFGHHDVSGVRAHVGGAAAEAAGAIGARAYATGDDVAVRAAPELRLAAHEAAHVVQQRGGVRLDGGVGRAGDAYEQHADRVADLVVRGESCEALLDTMAHRGAGGGPAVQRDDHDDDGHAAGGSHGHALHGSHARAHAAASGGGAGDAAPGGAATGEWNKTSPPHAGQTLNGHPIEPGNLVTINGISLHITRRGRGHWGIAYGSNNTPFLEAGERAARRLEEAGHTYQAAAARGAPVLHEGGVGAINTWDGMVFTLGPGYAGGRLASALGHLAGTPAGTALSAVPYLAGLRFNGDENVRLDVDALARIAHICEAEFPVDLAEAWILDLVARDAMAGGARAEHAADQAAGQTIPEVIGVAEYLHHGYGDYAGAPATRTAAAVAAHPGNPSAQVAHLLRAYAERAARDRAERPDTYRQRITSVATLRLPHKVVDFIQAARARDPSFHFDLAAARAVVPCLTTSGAFESTTTQPGGVYLDCEVGGEHRYWDYG
ncbi:MAG TPA: DUF4157 domain-containing protein [Kofleriaceae bacterium]|nr:DUF4157 domain-containing protein [Kofleriaceae bacterium]